VIGFPGAEQSLDPSLTWAERLYVRCLGVPVNGLRIRLRRVLPVTHGRYRRILDAGCGPGVFTMELAKRHPEAVVLGIDIEAESVRRAAFIANKAGISNCSFAEGDVTALGFNEEFDLIVSVDNLEHIQDDVLAMENLRDALTPRGMLVIHTPGYYRRWPVFGRRINFAVPGHMRPGYTPEELAAKLRRAGFDVTMMQSTYGILETLTNNLSYCITGAGRRNKALYAVVLPFLLAISYIGKFSRPGWGAGLLVSAVRPATGESPRQGEGR
jgi:SAM-dependent methyltransferase